MKKQLLTRVLLAVLCLLVGGGNFAWAYELPTGYEIKDVFIGTNNGDGTVTAETFSSETFDKSIFGDGNLYHVSGYNSKVYLTDFSSSYVAAPAVDASVGETVPTYVGGTTDATKNVMTFRTRGKNTSYGTIGFNHKIITRGKLIFSVDLNFGGNNKKNAPQIIFVDKKGNSVLQLGYKCSSGDEEYFQYAVNGGTASNDGTVSTSKLRDKYTGHSIRDIVIDMETGKVVYTVDCIDKDGTRRSKTTTKDISIGTGKNIAEIRISRDNGNFNSVDHYTYLDNIELYTVVPTSATSHTYTINAKAGETTIKTLVPSTSCTEYQDYEVYVPKVVQDGSGKYYVLSDDNLPASSFNAYYTMGTANEVKDIYYTLDESIVYYVEPDGNTETKISYSNGVDGHLNQYNYQCRGYDMGNQTAGIYTAETVVTGNTNRGLHVRSVPLNWNASSSTDNSVATDLGGFTASNGQQILNFTLTEGKKLILNGANSGDKTGQSLEFDYVIIRKTPVSYTVEYKCDATTIKTADATRTAVWGTNVAITDADKVDVTYGGHVYRYASDDASTQVIASDGTTVITVYFDDLGTVEVVNAIADCKTYEPSDAFATFIDAGSYASVEDVYVAHSVWQIAQATANGSDDFSKAIMNADFELGTLSGWTIYGDPATTESEERNNGKVDGTYTIDGSYSYYTGDYGRNVSQIIASLPAGRYRLTARVTSWNGGAPVRLFANGTLSTAENGENHTPTLDFTVIGNESNIKIGIGGTGNNDDTDNTWGTWGYRVDNFTLTSIDIDLASAKAILDAEIVAATTVKNTWMPKVGTTPFKYASTYYDILVSELAEATAVKNSGSETVSDYTTAKEELETAKNNIANSVMNQPASDKYYRLFMAEDGISTGKNLNMLSYGAGNTVITTTPYPIKFVKVDNNYIIENPYDYYIVTPKGNNSAWGAYIDFEEDVTMEVNANVWSIVPQEDGTFKLLSEQASWKGWNWYLGTHNTDEGAMVSPYDNSLPKNEREATKINWLCSDPVDITDVTLFVNATAGWGTFIAPYDNLTPSTVKAYTVAYKDNGRVYFEENESGVLNANTPYILSTNEASNVSVALKGIATNGETTTYTDNGLVGLMTAGSVPIGSYVMQYKDSKTSFYKVTDSPMTGTAYRCYLDLTSVPEKPANARLVTSFSVFGDETTGIGDASRLKDNGQRIKEVYNLQGQRVSQPVKGMYIVHGKKMVIK